MSFALRQTTSTTSSLLKTLASRRVISTTFLKYQRNFYSTSSDRRIVVPLSNLRQVNNKNKTFSRFNHTALHEEELAPKIDYNKMKEISEKKNPEYVIVDVREADEYKAGHIPGAINIPCKSSPGALGLYPDEFKLTFGFDKPSLDKTLVFYCLGGVRSSMSEELASTFGYTKRLNYVGSFADWMEHHGEVEKPAVSEPAAPTEDAKAAKATKEAGDADKADK